MGLVMTLDLPDKVSDTPDLFTYAFNGSTNSNSTKMNIPEQFTKRHQKNVENVFQSIELYNLKVKIEIRKTYLDSLIYIGDNWCSGISLSPSLESIENAKHFLDLLYSWLSSNRDFNLPLKFIFGPFPSGGISIELYFENSNTIFISFSNNFELSLEYKERNVYKESNFELNITNYFSKFKEIYRSCCNV